MRSNVQYFRIFEGKSLPDISSYSPFKAVLIIDVAVSPEWQATVSTWLVESGCLYMMAWGIECSSWDDSVDCANLEAFDWGDIPDDRFVMTTWHNDETLDEVFWFARTTAFHPSIELKAILLIDIVQKDRKAAMLDRLDTATCS